MLESERYDSLKAESLISFFDDPPEEMIKNEKLEDNPYIMVMDKNDADLFIHAGDLTGLQTFYLDGTLVYLGDGNITRAETVFRNHLGDSYPLLGLYLSLDSGRFQTARRMMEVLNERGESTPEIRLLMGDILLREKDFEAADDFYALFITRYPGESWISYCNLYLLRKSKGKDGGEILKSGLEYFPENKELSLMYAGFLLDKGDDSGS